MCSGSEKVERYVCMYFLKPVHELSGSPDSPLSDYRIQGTSARVQERLTPANELNTPNSRKLFGYSRTSQMFQGIKLPNRFCTSQPYWIICCASFRNIILNNHATYNIFEVSKLIFWALFKYFNIVLQFTAWRLVCRTNYKCTKCILHMFIHSPKCFGTPQVPTPRSLPSCYSNAFKWSVVW